MIPTMETIKNNLREMTIKQIHCDLTIGKTDYDKIPYTDEQITLFINNNSEKIDNCINEIYNDYEQDNELEDLVRPEQSLICEYLYEHISYPE